MTKRKPFTNGSLVTPTKEQLRHRIPYTLVTYGDALKALKTPKTGHQFAKRLDLSYGTALRIIKCLQPKYVKHVGYKRELSRGPLAKVYRAR